MKSFEKLILIASLALSVYAAYTLVAGLYSGSLCYQSRCAHRGTPGESFVGYAATYCITAAFGLASAWRSYKNVRTFWTSRRAANDKP
jgi:hypothetical protein